MRKSAAAALLLGTLLGTALIASPAHADSLATTDRAEAVEQAEAQGWRRGSTSFHGLLWFDRFHGRTNRVFPAVQTLGVCEPGHGRFTGLMAGPLNGDLADFGFLAPVQAEGGYDQGHSLTVEGAYTLDEALGGDAADGVHEVRLSCLSENGEVSEKHFAAAILVGGKQWIYAGPVRR